MKKFSQSLVFKFACIFAVFILFTLAMTSVITYMNQTRFYRQECEANIHNIGRYLENLIMESGEEFITYQNYYMAHFDEIDIPYDFDEYITAKEEYETLFATMYPERNLGKDIQFTDLDPKVQAAWFIYMHEYWFLVFENARRIFGLPYTYYLVPRPEIYHMVYMIDSERTRKDSDDGAYLYLGDEYYNDPALYRVEWETWFSGENKDAVQEWNNQWGHTYASYTLVKINGEQLGLIGTEIAVSRVTRRIMRNVAAQIGGMAGVLILCVFVLLGFINNMYISRIATLEHCVSEYAIKKDTNVARSLERTLHGPSEITSLGIRISEMIMELDQYMTNLMEIKQELSATRQNAHKLNDLAIKDSVTGIRNRIAYEAEVRRLEWQLADGHDDFGLAVIYLNSLDDITDAYGQEKGNAALKKLCSFVCNTFQHSPVFRIDIDEFAVILEKDDYKNKEKLVEQFKECLHTSDGDVRTEPWEKISASIGVAVFDRSTDTTVDNVFSRAEDSVSG